MLSTCQTSQLRATYAPAIGFGVFMASSLRASKKIFTLCAGLFLATLALAQTGHPAKGTWLGHWGPSESEQRRVVILLDWRDLALGGTLNPGPRAAKISKAEIDFDTWTMTVEADLATKAGETPKRWVATGKLENLGSWTNRRYSGTYTHGTETGRFTATLN